MNRAYGHRRSVYGSWGLSTGAEAVFASDDAVGPPSATALVGTGGQIVSGLSASGASSSKKGVRALASSGKTIAGAAGIVGTAAALGAPLNAIPVAGQIAFAAIVVGAATFAFIKKMREGRLTNAQADKLAKKYGVDDDLKHYVRKIMRMSKTKRTVELAKQKKRYSQKTTGGFLKKVKTAGRSKKRMKEKIDILKQVIEFDKAEARAKAAAKAAGASDAAIAASMAPEQTGNIVDSIADAIGVSTSYALPLGLGAAALVIFLIVRSSRSSA